MHGLSVCYVNVYIPILILKAREVASLEVATSLMEEILASNSPLQTSTPEKVIITLKVFHTVLSAASEEEPPAKQKCTETETCTSRFRSTG